MFLLAICSVSLLENETFKNFNYDCDCVCVCVCVSVIVYECEGVCAQDFSLFSRRLHTFLTVLMTFIDPRVVFGRTINGSKW